MELLWLVVNGYNYNDLEEREDVRTKCKAYVDEVMREWMRRMAKSVSRSVAGVKDTLDEDKQLRRMFREEGNPRAGWLFAQSMKWAKKQLRRAARREAKVIEEDEDDLA